ncbi:MAG TPA: hypothetical protein VHE33_00240 [Acidobacteriaceae bacterium]|nr:hypothetical protein [Acidobacteriaceae bacterium]
MPRRRAAWIIVAAVLTLCAAMGWYCLAADYDYPSLAGTYVFQDDAGSCTLRLYANRNFEEELKILGNVRIARGSWRRFGESGMALSDSFLKVPGQKPGPSGENYATFYKRLGIFPVLQIDSTSGRLQFHRKLINW